MYKKQIIVLYVSLIIFLIVTPVFAENFSSSSVSFSAQTEEFGSSSENFSSPSVSFSADASGFGSSSENFSSPSVSFGPISG